MRAIITNSDYRAHSAPLFSKLKIFDIYQINAFHIAKFMYCYRNNLLPLLFFNFFLRTVKLMAIAPEQPITIPYIIAEQIIPEKIHTPLPRSKDLEFPPCSNYFFVKLSQF